MNAGKTSNYFKLERHTKQRDPVSEFLFIHGIYFFFSLEQNKDIKGIELFQEKLIYRAYADKRLVFSKGLRLYSTI